MARQDVQARLKGWEIETLIAWFMYRLRPDDRHELMTDLPRVYNKLCEREIVRVINVADQTERSAEPAIKRPVRASSGGK